MCEAWHRLIGTIVHLYLSLCVVTVMLKVSSLLSYSAPHSQFEISDIRLQTNMDRCFHFYKLLPKLCFLLSASLCVTSSCVAVP